MSLNSLVSPQAVIEAMAEFDRIGRESFLEKYGYGPARSYFVFHHGKFYDSKAIAGVAVGYQDPSASPLTSDSFYGGEKTVMKKLSSLGFHVINKKFYPSNEPIVLVENEITAGGLYDDWKDVTGNLYHFPNQYKNKVIPGKRFIYYRGVRRKDGKRGVPEYFGTGVISDVWLDENTANMPSNRQNYFASIDDYIEFKTTVPAKENSVSLEKISNNLYQMGVRNISKKIYDLIISKSGLTLSSVLDSDDLSKFITDDLNDAVLADKTTPIIVLSKPKNNGPSNKTGGWRSKYSKKIGDIAEEVVITHLKKNLHADVVDSLRWVAQEGDKPGWDIEYKDSSGCIIAFEVKGTQGPTFSRIEITANEWRAACEHRNNYHLVLVAKCMSSPIIKIIQDPAGLAEKKSISITPTSYVASFNEQV